MVNNDKNIHNYVIDKSKLNIDWERQRAEINKKISGKSPIGITRWIYAAVTIVAIAAVSFFSWYIYVGSIDEGARQFYSSDETDDDYIPDCLYVLNGFTMVNDAGD